jgi:hypothetical protein
MRKFIYLAVLVAVFLAFEGCYSHRFTYTQPEHRRVIVVRERGANGYRRMYRTPQPVIAKTYYRKRSKGARRGF